jgi:hypothetical protein
MKTKNLAQNMTDSLIDRLQTADFVCKDCGLKYGRYSVGCSSTWTGTCHVCGERKPITEVRDYGYLQPGIDALQKRDTIKTQSKVVAQYMCNQEENDELASYEQGEYSLMLTSEEVVFLNLCLDVIAEAGVEDEDVEVFEGLGSKLGELYADYCVDYKLSPVTAAYHKKYGTFGLLPEEADHYRKFKDNYEMLLELGFITEGDNA